MTMTTTQMTQPLQPSPAEAERPLRELNTRISDGLQVDLLWNEADDLVVVRVEDQRTGEGFSVTVKPDQSPIDVFITRSRTHRKSPPLRARRTAAGPLARSHA